MHLSSITPLILTYNEAPNIGRTLERLRWADQVIVVDSYSTDETLDILKSFPNVRVFQREFQSFADQCNFGVTQIETPWVLSLDADYVLAKDFEKEVIALCEESKMTGYWARFRYCIHGLALRASIYPARLVLYQKERAQYIEDGHAHRVHVNGPKGWLKSAIDHDDRKPLDRWIRSQDSYARLEAEKLSTAEGKEGSLRDRIRRTIVLAPLLTLIYTLFAKRLLLDGWPGWYYAFLRTTAEMMISLRLMENNVKGEKGSREKSRNVRRWESQK